MTQRTKKARVSDTAWLDDDTAWLDRPLPPPRGTGRSASGAPAAGFPEAPNGHLVSAVKLTNEKKRFLSMVKRLVGRDRVWASDGEYVAFRPKLANPATLERHNRFIATGNYKHVTTQDDVQLFQLMEGSPFKRAAMNVSAMKYSDIRRSAVLAACSADWGLFVDILTEMSTQLKNKFHEGMAKQIYESHLVHVFSMIEMRRGPSRAVIDAGVQSLRLRRGDSSGRVILIPSTH